MDEQVHKLYFNSQAKFQSLDLKSFRPSIQTEIALIFSLTFSLFV